MQRVIIEVSKQAVLFSLLFVLGLGSSADAAKRKRRHHQENPPASNAPKPNETPENDSEVARYLSKTLDIENPAEFDLTMAFLQRLKKLAALRGQTELNEALAREIALKGFSEQSAETIREIVRAFFRTNYSNAIVLGQAGVGKTFLIDQLVALFSFGVVPDFLAESLGPEAGSFKQVREAFLGHSDVVLVNLDLLSRDNTEGGKAWSSEEVRMSTILTGLFKAASQQFQKNGRRTIFIFDEVATLPKAVQKTLKKILDKTGLKNPSSPEARVEDAGYNVIAMTTPDEYREMIDGDSATERRYRKVKLPEPSEEAAFRILRSKADAEWEPLYGMKIEDQALKLLIHMRKVLSSPPLAMPASVLSAANDLFLSRLGTADKGDVITVKEAREYLTKATGLTGIWFEGPNGEPPFHNLAAEVKKLVVGQDEVVDKIAARIAAWGRFSFGEEVPVFILGGKSGSGKDTIFRAFSQVLFGHDSSHLMFSIGNAEGFAIDALISGPPRGNHSDSKPGLIVSAMENGPAQGLLGFNEGKDCPTAELEKLKVFIESAVIKPQGRDARSRPLLFPIFLMGQWGEEIGEGKSELEIREIFANMTQSEIEDIIMSGKENGGKVRRKKGGKKINKSGSLSRAIIDRAKASGGVYFLMPVERQYYPLIVRMKLGKVEKRFQQRQETKVFVSDKLVQYIADHSTNADEGPRGLSAVTIDFSESAISAAIDQGLRLEQGEEIKLDVAENAIVVTSAKKNQSWEIPAAKLARTKNTAMKTCEAIALGEPLKKE